MLIHDIRAIPLRHAACDGGWEDGIADNLHTLIRVETDTGLTGIGSCYTSAALVEASLRVLKPLLVGESAVEPERVSEKLHQTTFWQGRGGAVTHTISGIDTALWDLLGQASGQPVSRLLGGMYRDRLKPYASILFEEPDKLKEKIARLTEAGFRAIKIGWGSFGRVDGKYDELLVRSAREAAGPDVELMVDAGASDPFWPHGYKWALQTAKMLAGYDVVWFEEALPPDQIDDYVKLREHAPVMISAGEVLTRRQSFLPWLERGAVDIIQPDVTKVGGLSEARRIGWMAQDRGVLLVPHGWNTAVGLAADLHLTAAMPAARWVEYKTPAPFIDDIVTVPFKLDDAGNLPVPKGPGLGIVLDEERLAKYG